MKMLLILFIIQIPKRKKPEPPEKKLVVEKIFFILSDSEKKLLNTKPPPAIINKIKKPKALAKNFIFLKIKKAKRKENKINIKKYIGLIDMSSIIISFVLVTRLSFINSYKIG